MTVAAAAFSPTEILPRRSRGRQSTEAIVKYRTALKRFCDLIVEMNSTLDFRVSSRGWCYLLEPHGLLKGDFDYAQGVINDARKSGDLPLDICSEDDGRATENLERLDDTTPEHEADWIVKYTRRAHLNYRPFSFWDFQDYYLQMLTEKVDLKSLFSPVCKEFLVPIANAGGWGDINGRAAMMRRFAEKEAEGKQCVLLYCGDHDPGGLNISEFLRSNLADLAGAVGWSPDNLEIIRFGLNADFIRRHRLTWIENLATSKGEYPLDDWRHADHLKPYVQDYLKRFGARKVEANALVTRVDAGRELCRTAIMKYLNVDGIRRYERKLKAEREKVRRLVADTLRNLKK